MPRGRRTIQKPAGPSDAERRYYGNKVRTVISQITDMILGAGRMHGAYTPADIQTFSETRDKMYLILNRLEEGR